LRREYTDLLSISIVSISARRTVTWRALERNSRAEGQLKSPGREEDVNQLRPAFTRIDEAQRLAGQLDQSANARAAEAAQIIDVVRGDNATR
jgi:hypothetical protein